MIYFAKAFGFSQNIGSLFADISVASSIVAAFTVGIVAEKTK